MLNRIDQYLGRDARILLLGDVMLDRYVLGQAERISPEAPVPVLKVARRWSTPGGAGNVAMNLAGLGASVTLMAVTGEDEPAAELTDLLRSAGVEVRFHKASRPTTTKTRLLSHSQQMMRLDEEETSTLAVEDRRRIVESLASLDIKRFDAVVLSDYAKGACFEDFCRAAIEQATLADVPILVDPKGRDWDRYRGATLVTPNLKELCVMAGRDVANEDDAVVEAGRPLLERLDIKHLLVTRSEKGMTLLSADRAHHIETTAQEVCDVSGAGDTVVAATARFLASGAPLHEAVALANEAAGCVVRHAGTHAITERELRRHMVERYGADSRRFESVVSFDEAASLADSLRREGKKVIFTNGCFDLLHRGHLTYLKEARALGDVLIVGLNTDDSVRRLKGPERPVNDEDSRALMLSSLKFVDYVILFGDDTPAELCRRLQPDVLVKGGDNRVENIPGREHAKETLVLSFVDGFSSTRIIAKVRDTDEEKKAA